MVDLISQSLPVRKERAVCARFEASVIVNSQEAKEFLRSMPSDTISTGYQLTSFLEACLAQADFKPVFIILNAKGFGKVLLPLELRSNRIVGYCGGTHANGNFPVGTPRDIEALNDITKKELTGLLKDLKCGADAVFLERQHTEWNGVKNPFCFKTSLTSPNLALSLSLEGGFDAVLSRHQAKRKRKNRRRSIRLLEEMGTLHIDMHIARDKVSQTLRAFYEMKAERFKSEGICDVFAEQAIKDMFEAMFVNSWDQTKPNHVLKAVFVDDIPAAIIGCTCHDGRTTVEFGAFNADFSVAGPGELLFDHAIEDACERGFEIFDFGIGDEFYKRRWTDFETWHRETSIAITPTGYFKSMKKRLGDRFAIAIKTNPKIWSKFKTIRKKLSFLRICLPA